MEHELQWMDYLRALLALLFVSGLIFFLRVGLTRAGLDKRFGGVKGAAGLKVVESLYLDARRRLVVVRCGERDHLLLLSNSGDLHIESCKGEVSDAPQS